MLLIGLTGSIATGKSTVSNILAHPPFNLPIIDADVIAREVVAPGTPAYNKIVEHFGSTTPDLLVQPTSGDSHASGPDDKGWPLNRPALGRRVFGQEKEADRKILNGIVHPAVRKEIYRQIISAYIKGNWAVVLDVPLLYESGWEPLCGTIIVVAVSDPKLQMQRLRARDEHLSEGDAHSRVASQWNVKEKAQRCLLRGPGAGLVLWNDGDKTTLEQDISKAMHCLRKTSPQWWTWVLLICPPIAVVTCLNSYIRSIWVQRLWAQKQAREKAML